MVNNICSFITVFCVVASVLLSVTASPRLFEVN